jgi:hypothetical protein
LPTTGNSNYGETCDINLCHEWSSFNMTTQSWIETSFKILDKPIQAHTTLLY